VYLYVYLYVVAFMEKDTAGMGQQMAWSAGKPGVEDLMVELEAEAYAYSGQLKKARELSYRAVEAAEHAQEKETAGSYEGSAALREALLGNSVEAEQRAKNALALSLVRGWFFRKRTTRALRWLVHLGPSLWHPNWPKTSRKTRRFSSIICRRFGRSFQCSATTL
jgi:hypothetical protein